MSMEQVNDFLKRALLWTALSSGCLVCAGQDLIVTTTGDSIRCEITAVREKKLFYASQENGRSKNKSIERAMVASYRRVGYAPVELNRTTFVPYVEPPKQEPRRDTSVTLERPILWNLFGGYGWVRRLGSASDEQGSEWQEHNEGLRSGLQYSAGFNYYVSDQFAIGARFTGCAWAHSSTGLPIPVQGDSTALFDVETEIRMYTIGPALIWRPTKHGDDADLTFALSTGLTEYEENNIIEGVTVKLRGVCLYGSLIAALDLHLTENLTIGASTGLSLGTLKRLEITAGGNSTNSGVVELDKDEHVGLQRLQYGLQLGVSF